MRRKRRATVCRLKHHQHRYLPIPARTRRRTSITPSFIHPGQGRFLGRTSEPRAEEITSPPEDGKVSGGGKNQPWYIHHNNRHSRAEIKLEWTTTSYRGRREQACVDRYIIILIINLSRPERAVVYLSMNHHLSLKEGMPRAGESILGRGKSERQAAVCRSIRHQSR